MVEFNYDGTKLKTLKLRRRKWYFSRNNKN